MAEFSEVMKQLARMTSACNGKCDECPLDDSTICTGPWCSGNMECIAEAERIVMQWAAEHPEPVYPTWKEWLEEQRVVVHFDSVSEKGTKVKWELTNKSNCRIPADIAQKLGIEPKGDA